MITVHSVLPHHANKYPPGGFIMSAKFLKIPAPGEEAQIRKLMESVESARGPTEAWHGSPRPLPKIHWECLSVTVHGYVACCSGLLRVSRKYDQANRFINLWRRATVRLEKMGGAWRIVHARFHAVSSKRSPTLLPAPWTQDASSRVSLPSPAFRSAPCAQAFDLQP
jgi:hypothetical protein